MRHCSDTRIWLVIFIGFFAWAVEGLIGGF